MSRIGKIRRQSMILAASGSDVLFLESKPEQEVGESVCLLLGSMSEEPSMFLCVRRVLNELKSHLEKKGLELEFTIKHIGEESNEVLHTS